MIIVVITNLLRSRSLCSYNQHLPELLTDYWEAHLMVGPWPAGKHQGGMGVLPSEPHLLVG